MIPQQPRSFTTHNGNRKWDAQANLAKLHIFDLIDFYEWIQYIDILAKGYDKMKDLVQCQKEMVSAIVN